MWLRENNSGRSIVISRWRDVSELRREYGLVYCAGLSNKTGCFLAGIRLRDKLHDLAHLLTKAGNGGNIPPMTASVSDANIMPRASNASSEPGRVCRNQACKDGRRGSRRRKSSGTISVRNARGRWQGINAVTRQLGASPVAGAPAVPYPNIGCRVEDRFSDQAVWAARPPEIRCLDRLGIRLPWVLVHAFSKFTSLE